MRGQLLKAALTVLFLVASVAAQRIGPAGSHAGFAGRAGFVRHLPVPATARGRQHFSGVTPDGFRTRHLHNRFHRRLLVGFPAWWSYGYSDDLWYYGYPNDQEDDPHEEKGISGELYAELHEQQREIERLRHDVEELSATGRAAPAAKPEAKPEPKCDGHSLTTLLFRDNHTEEVQNYALVGQTLWILNEDRARKVPLGDLDVPATIKANDERGIDFKVPH